MQKIVEGVCKQAMFAMAGIYRRSYHAPARGGHGIRIVFVIVPAPLGQHQTSQSVHMNRIAPCSVQGCEDVQRMTRSVREHCLIKLQMARNKSTQISCRPETRGCTHQGHLSQAPASGRDGIRIVVVIIPAPLQQCRNSFESGEDGFLHVCACK